jgi:hypothetical protein
VLLIAFKLLITPVMIAAATLAGRRWGSAASGLMIGLPLTSGPISFILAYQHGAGFAAQAAAGGIAGQISICCFCLTYVLATRKFDWPLCVGLAIGAFLVSTCALNSWGVLRFFPAFFALLGTIALVLALIPQRRIDAAAAQPPRWDLPARMLAATSFVVVLTTLSDALGPQLSGLFSPFPIFGIVFAAFTHAQQGAAVAANLLRAMVVSSLGYASFFLVVGTLLTRVGIGWTYLLAAFAAAAASASVYLIAHRRREA